MVSSTKSNAAERTEILQRLSELLLSQRQRIDGFVQDNHRRLRDWESRLTEQFSSVEQRCEDWAAFQDRLSQRYRSLQDAEYELETRQTALAARAEEVDRIQQATKDQRRRAAEKIENRRRQLRAEQSAQTQDLQQRIAELERERTAAHHAQQESQATVDRNQQVIADHQRTIDDLRQQLANAQLAHADSARTRETITGQQRTIDDLRRQLTAAQAAEADSARTRDAVSRQQQTIDELQRQLAESQASQADSELNREAIAGQQRTIDELQQSITHLTAQLRETREAAAHDRQELADAQARYDMAMESVESLRDKNDQLEKEVTELQSAATSSPAARHGLGSGDDSWEATKRRMLANLDGEELSPDEQGRLDAAIQQTESQLAEKDREIEDLRAQLSNLMASPTSARESNTSQEHEAILDANEIIAAEREKLAQLQAELHEKLRSSEVECAKERAQNTRLRSELQEKLRDVEIELARARGAAGAPGKSKGTGRRWLEHLGLHPDKP